MGSTRRRLGVLLAVLGLCGLAPKPTAALRLAPRMAISQVVPSARTLRYDYIIVGGGTAGCVLANRLTEDKDCRVLMIEAGDKPNGVEIDAPAALTKLFNSRFDWSFGTEREAGAAGRSIFVSRGKALGGSSCLNAMLYTRGARSDFAAWEAAGGEEWGADELLSYYKRHEDHHDGASEFHGKGGPVKVQQVPYQNPLSRAFLKACKRLGFAANDDFNDWSRSQEGVGRFAVTSTGGKRHSAYRAYLEPIKKRPNLEISTDCRATRIIFDNNRAVGVEFMLDDTGERSSAYLNYGDGAEVLLTAGAVASPHLLLLSGVGPQEHLAEHGVKVVADAPGVGQGLRDQPACVVAYNVHGKNTITDHIFRRNSSRLRLRTLLNFLVRGKGALTSPGCDHGGFFHTDEKAKAAGAEPDLQMRFVAGRGDSADGVKSYESLGKAGHVASGITFQCIAVRPESKGEVRLGTTDPLAPPLIKNNFLDSERDVRSLREGLKLAERIATEGTIGEAGGGLGRRVFPSEIYGSVRSTAVKDADDAALDKYIRETVHSANAVVGTCAMGDVVDGSLRVKGTERLRVVDASVMPTLPGGQGASHVYTIAEKGADMIKASGLMHEKAMAKKTVPAARTVKLRSQKTQTAARE
mmetsp:Transcript_21908/g.67277  ORF Transcript_21908/g.67277 Transcript_21908/m.67277 type:complete len:638 (-) Transcript_21908:488-2401(-)